MKKKILFCIVFCIVFFPIIFFINDWWFYSIDDFTALAQGAGGELTWSQFWECFQAGNVRTINLATNFLKAKNTFSNVFYRPLCYFAYIFLHKIFGLNALLYFYLNTFLHAINSALLFYIFSFFFKKEIAVIGALLFAFHPQFGYIVFGHMSYLQHYVTLCIYCLLFILLRRYRLSNNITYLFCSSFLFFISIFFREIGLVAPFILLLYLYFIEKKHTPSNMKYVFWMFLSIVFFYLFCKFFSYPVVGNGEFLPWRELFNIPLKIANMLITIKDVFWLSVIAGSYKFISYSLAIFFSCLFLFGLVKEKKWGLYFFLLGSFLLLSWPNMLLPYNPRYIYESYPFFIFSILHVAREKYILTSNILRKIFIIGLLVCGGGFFISNLKIRSCNLLRLRTAVLGFVKGLGDCVKQEGIRPICFFCLPANGLLSGLEQAIWLFGKNTAIPVYLDHSTVLQASSLIALEQKGLFLKAASLPLKNDYSIRRDKYIFHFEVKKNDALFFYSDKSCLGDRLYEEKENGKTVSFALKIHEKYMIKDTLFFVFDYENALLKKID